MDETEMGSSDTGDDTHTSIDRVSPASLRARRIVSSARFWLLHRPRRPSVDYTTKEKSAKPSSSSLRVHERC
jgi:hypothetical protein